MEKEESLQGEFPFSVDISEDIELTMDDIKWLLEGKPLYFISEPYEYFVKLKETR